MIFGLTVGSLVHVDLDRTRPAGLVVNDEWDFPAASARYPISTIITKEESRAHHIPAPGGL